MLSRKSRGLLVSLLPSAPTASEIQDRPQSRDHGDGTQDVGINKEAHKGPHDVMRHMMVHFPQTNEVLDCSVATCGRRGENGFKREDDRQIHFWNVHMGPALVDVLTS